MPLPRSITRLIGRSVNPLMLRLVGRASIVDLEHVGRTSGTVRHTPLMAFRADDVVTIALTYGPGVQWLKNVRAAGGCRMRMGGEILRLGPPRAVEPDVGRSRIPQPQRSLLRWPVRCRSFIELPVLSSSPVR